MEKGIWGKITEMTGKICRVETEPTDVATGRNLADIVSAECNLVGILSYIRNGGAIVRDTISKVDTAYSQKLKAQTTEIQRQRRVVLFEKHTFPLPPLKSQ